ncbi:MAG TPA: CBS domain-containing protein [Actinomycetota bacterium]|jgi:CBS domain-containing protein|nr:CBS domain-containing protein [Actinomycetota bacterium]
MKVEAIYHPRIMTIQADDTLETAAERMQDSQVRSLVVVEDGELRGILTEHDITRAVADGANPATVPVWEYLTLDPATVTLDTEVGDAVRAMLEFDFRHLPVVQAGAVVGMVSLRDLVSAVPAT